MTHLSDSQLNEYLDHSIGSSARRATEVHLEACPGCRARLAEVQRVFAALAGLPEAPLPRDLSQSILMRLPQKSPRIWTRALAAQLGSALGLLLWLSLEITKPVTALLLTLALPKFSVPDLRLPEYSFRFPAFDFQAVIPRVQIAIPGFRLPSLVVSAFEPALAIPLSIAVFAVWIVANNALLRAHNGVRR
jgi:putative zinc finger protein